MILAHIADDFYLQGNLAKMKQKVWWEKLFEYKSLYKHDYKMALLIHSFNVLVYNDTYPKHDIITYSLIVSLARRIYHQHHYTLLD